MSPDGVTSPWSLAAELQEDTQSRHRGCALLLGVRRCHRGAAAFDLQSWQKKFLSPVEMTIVGKL